MSTKQSANFRDISLVDFIALIFLVVFSMAILPSFLQQPIKPSLRTEARQYIYVINKGQQAYYFENGEFSNNIPDLGLGIELETRNYSYKIKEINSKKAIATATNKHNLPYYYQRRYLPFLGKRLPFYRRIHLSKIDLKSYSGIVYIEDNTTQTMICETDQPSLTAPDNFQSFDQCPLGSSAL